LSEQEILKTRLKEAREELGLTIEEIADRMTVSARTVKNWELGRTTPRSNRLHILSGILGVPFAWLLNGGTDQYAKTNRVGRIKRVEQKLERMTQLRSQMSRLSAEITAEVSEIRRADEELETLAA
jgi:transcriptional regulator with XRE-family HTH domain